MKQVWHPFWEWEDYKAGMWTRVSKKEERDMIVIAKNFTGDWLRYGDAMERVVFEWPITMEHNLTNPSLNHKAFVGHCACCLETGIPEYITRAAWKMLSDQQQGLANFAAEKHIAKWREFHLKKKSQRGLFDE
jgi:hypothetical protein